MLIHFSSTPAFSTCSPAILAAFATGPWFLLKSHLSIPPSKEKKNNARNDNKKAQYLRFFLSVSSFPHGAFARTSRGPPEGTPASPPRRTGCSVCTHFEETLAIPCVHWQCRLRRSGLVEERQVLFDYCNLFSFFCFLVIYFCCCCYCIGLLNISSL